MSNSIFFNKNNKNNKNMKRLNDKIKYKSFIYNKIKRNNFKAIYSQHNIDVDGNEIKDHIVAYEVFRISTLKAGELFGSYYPEREKFPSDTAFGVTAWSYKTLESAEKKYNEINEIQHNESNI